MRNDAAIPMFFVTGIPFCLVLPCFATGCHTFGLKIATAAPRPRNDTKLRRFSVFFRSKSAENVRTSAAQIVRLRGACCCEFSFVSNPFVTGKEVKKTQSGQREAKKDNRAGRRGVFPPPTFHYAGKSFFGLYSLFPVSIHRIKSLMDFSSQPAARNPRMMREASCIVLLFNSFPLMVALL